MKIITAVPGLACDECGQPAALMVRYQPGSLGTDVFCEAHGRERLEHDLQVYEHQAVYLTNKAAAYRRLARIAQEALDNLSVHV